MAKLRVASFSVSLDGYGAGIEQGLSDPMGKGGMALHGWALGTRTLRKMFGMEGGDTGVDDDFAQRGFHNIGSWVLGRNMFGPVRGAWPDESWRGWWGEVPPYQCDVFVLTHHPRAPLVLADTTFHFVTDGLEAALSRAFAAAGGKDVRLGGGVATVRAALAGRLVDEMHLALSPVLLGRGENLFAGLDLPGLGYGVTQSAATAMASHVVMARS